MELFYDKNALTDSRGHSNYLNNVKFILILLVVIGHLVSNITEISPFARGLDLFIYSFHMPAFLFISGYFSKNCSKSWKKALQNAFYYFCIYLVSNIIFDLFQRYVTHSVQMAFQIFKPRIGLWYLLVLVIWTLFLPLIRRIPAKLMLPLSFLPGFYIGFFDHAGKYFALSRLCTFFPFFVAGLYFPKNSFEKTRRKSARMAGCIFFLSYFLFCQLVPGILNRSMLLGNTSYANMHLSMAQGLVARFAWYIVAFLLLAAFLCLIPHGKLPFTCLGERTMQIFILHSILCRTLYVWNITEQIGRSAGAGTVILLGIVLTFLLSCHFFTPLFTWPKKIWKTMENKLVKTTSK